MTHISKEDLLVSKDLERIFSDLLKEIKKVSGKDHAVSLCIFNSEAGSRVNYISNTDRELVAGAWELMIRHWNETNMPDIPAHKLM